MNAPTEKQVNFWKKLLAERDLPVVDFRPGTSRREASEAIDGLLRIPRKTKQPQAQLDEFQSVPAGKYALVRDDQTMFYVVDRPERGKWAGWVFLSKLEGDNRSRIANRGANANIYREVMTAIAADVEGAARRYGHHRNECAYCNHGLTTQYSRFFGIGPVCAKRNGMPASFAQYTRRGGQAAVREVVEWKDEDARELTRSRSLFTTTTTLDQLEADLARVERCFVNSTSEQERDQLDSDRATITKLIDEYWLNVSHQAELAEAAQS